MGTGTDTEKETKTKRMIGMRVESGMRMRMIVGSFQRQALSVIMRGKAHLQKIGKIDMKTDIDQNQRVAIHLARKWRNFEVKF